MKKSIILSIVIAICSGYNTLFGQSYSALVKDINTTANTSGSSPNQTIKMGGNVYFVARHSTAGRKLWKSDGTETGTVLVKDINNGTNNADIFDFCVVGTTLFFAANNGIIGKEL